MELDYRAIGSALKLQGLSLNESGKTCGARWRSPTHMSNIETGTTRVSLQTIVRLANALSVSVDDLFVIVSSRQKFNLKGRSLNAR